jgi:hypothetical protein
VNQEVNVVLERWEDGYAEPEAARVLAQRAQELEDVEKDLDKDEVMLTSRRRDLERFANELRLRRAKHGNAKKKLEVGYRAYAQALNDAEEDGTKSWGLRAMLEKVEELCQ